MSTVSGDDDATLVEAALSRGLFSQAEAEEALRKARAARRPVADVLVESGLLAPRTIDSLRADPRTQARPTLSSPAPPRELGVPGRLGEYELVEKLGEGGMGAVYRARQGALQREVALKVVAPQVAADPEYAERFLREARAAARVSHPNVITIFDAKPIDGRLVMALELMPGGDAAQLLQRSGGRLPEARALRLVHDCARGLAALAKAGLVHRDIKPANVFIAQDGTAKLADLGLARSRSGDDRMTNSGVIVGTPAFMAPEQADGSTDLDVRTDIYALGATLYQLVTGEPPYTGTSAMVVVSKVLTAPVPDPRDLRPDLSPLTAEVIARCLAKDRADRPRTAEELALALEKARRALGAGASSRRAAVQRRQPGAAGGAPPAGAPPARAEGPAPALVLGGVGALLVLLLGLAGLLVRRSPPTPPPPPPIATHAPTSTTPVAAPEHAADTPTEPAEPAEPPASVPTPVEPAEPPASVPTPVEPVRATPPAVDRQPPAAPHRPPPPDDPAGVRTPDEPGRSPGRRVRAAFQRFLLRPGEIAFDVSPAADAPATVSQPHARGELRRIDGGARSFARASFNAGEVSVPGVLVYKVGARVERVVTRKDLEQAGHGPLVRQGFTRPGGVFCELGLRADQGHCHEGVKLEDTAWLSLVFGKREVFGLLRAVGKPPAVPGAVAERERLDLARRQELGFQAYRPPGGRDPGFVVEPLDPEDQLMVRWDMRPQGWSCSVHLIPQGKLERTRPLHTTQGTWADMGLVAAPEVVWAWAHAGNWASGQGVVELVARVGGDR
ncbi:MAG: serine/threonine protein kinase [Planctomycetes bacterium]|nr:serine/threonine protein kinase [Planctomycetota bacterium]